MLVQKKDFYSFLISHDIKKVFAFNYSTCNKSYQISFSVKGKEVLRGNFNKNIPMGKDIMGMIVCEKFFKDLWADICCLIKKADKYN